MLIEWWTFLHVINGSSVKPFLLRICGLQAFPCFEVAASFDHTRIGSAKKQSFRWLRIVLIELFDENRSVPIMKKEPFEAKAKNRDL